MSYDPTTNEGQIRLLISDTDTANHLFSDTEITAFLSLAGSNVFRAAGLALRAIAGNETQVLKRIRLLDLDTDGPAVAKALIALAESYEARDERTQATFGFAEIAIPPFGKRQRIENEYLRNA